MIVAETIDGFPSKNEVSQVRREEDLLLEAPDPGPMKLWQQYPPLGVMSMPMRHIPAKFSTPKGVFENEEIHIEWQQLNGRQPFYHRNLDCDEIAFHVCGERSVLTELGTVDVEVGDFSMIPRGVCHDNRAIDDVHLLFYIPAPVEECKRPHRVASFREVPFDGWKPGKPVEFVTEHLGAMGSEASVFRTDEAMLLAEAQRTEERLHVIRPDVEHGVDWLYKGQMTWLGYVTISHHEGEISYQRHLCAHEIQIQVQGRRTLLSQRGKVELEPGDFVCIPKGCAFRSLFQGDKSAHIVVLTTQLPAAKQPFTKYAGPAISESA